MSTCGRRGFTLVEMAIAVTVVGILGGLALPNLNRAISKADAAKVVSDMRTVSLAVHAYVEDNGGLPRRSGRWGRPPAYLTEFLPDNMPFTYKATEYRLIIQRRKGRAIFRVRYPRNHPIGEALKVFRRPGEVTWTRRRTDFILVQP